MNLPDLSQLFKILSWHKQEQEFGKSVGLFVPLPAHLAIQYPEDGRTGEDSSPPHITVVYIGSFPKELEKKLVKLTQEICSNAKPFKVKLTRTKTFFTENKQTIFHSPVKSKKLTNFHSDIKNHFMNNQIQVDTKYPDYNPHVTIEYVNEGDKPKYKGLHIIDEFVVDSVWIWGTYEPYMVPFGR